VLTSLEQQLAAGERTEALVVLAWRAGREVSFDDTVLRGPTRRAVLLLAAGGDPLHGLALDGRAVSALAEELDAPEPRAALAVGMTELYEQAADLPLVREALSELLADPDLAWHAFACGLLAEALAE
jgi:hypothetical protein